MEIILKENERLDDVIARLQNSFEMVKDIAPVAYWYEHLNANGRAVDIHYSDRMREMLGYKTVEEFPDELNTIISFTHPDDVQIMLDGAIAAGTGKTDKYDVEYRIRMASGEYKWCNATGILVKDHKGVTVGMYGSFVDIDSKKNLEAQEALQKRRLALINKMAGKDGVFIVNCANNTFRTINDRLKGNEKLGSERDYKRSVRKYVRRYTVEPDQKMVMELVDPAYMLEHTKDDNEITARFRDTITGRPRYIEMRIVRLSENEVVQSFIDCNDSMIEGLAHARLIDEYDALYMLDIQHNEITPVRTSRVTQVGVFKGRIKYDEVAMRFADTVAPKYREDWVNFSDVNYVKEYLKDEDHREFVYELPGTKIKLRRVSFDVIERIEGEASTVLMSFMGIDDQRAQTILLHRKIAEQKQRAQVDSETISGLASEYLSLYHINLDTQEFRVYQIDSNRLADTQKLITQKIDIFGLVHKFALSSVHPEDRQFFLDMDYDFIRKLLAHRKKYTHRYRRDYGSGYLWSEMDLIKYEERDEPVNLVIIGFAERDNVIRKEIEQQNEVAKYHKILDSLSGDFSCVDYIAICDDKLNDTVEELRISEKLNEYFPEWSSTKKFSKRLDIVTAGLVYEPDKKQFFDETRREVIIRKLENSDTYFVNTRFDRDNTIRYFQLKFSAVREDGKLIGMVVGLHSIDEQMKAEIKQRKDLENALQKAETASRAKTDFLFYMSHDIRTPMNAILGYTDAAIRHFKDGDRAMDSLKKIKSSGAHLLGLINDILEMSRVESGKMELTEHPIDIRDLIDTTDNMGKALAIPKSIKFTTVLEDLNNPYVYADELHYSEVIINLISNAVKYTNEDGAVVYQVSQYKNDKDGKFYCRFEVSDNGIGMSEEFQKHLFEAFAREKTTTVSRQQGTGLGLSIVKKIIDLAGGSITVRSKVGVGTTIIVDIPLRVLTEEEIKEFFKFNSRVEENEHHTISLEGKKVLLVEDNELNREIAEMILQESGLVVECAEDGDVAVKTIKEKGLDYFDAILMDIQMPVMDGYEATRTIREIEKSRTDAGKKHIPIIAVSANAFAEDRLKSHEAGMDDHIAKPIVAEKFMLTLSKHMK